MASWTDREREKTLRQIKSKLEVERTELNWTVPAEYTNPLIRWYWYTVWMTSIITSSELGWVLSPIIHHPTQPWADMRENLLDNLQIENKLKYYREQGSNELANCVSNLFKLGCQWIGAHENRRCQPDDMKSKLAMYLPLHLAKCLAYVKTEM